MVCDAGSILPPPPIDKGQPRGRSFSLRDSACSRGSVRVLQTSAAALLPASGSVSLSPGSFSLTVHRVPVAKSASGQNSALIIHRVGRGRRIPSLPTGRQQPRWRGESLLGRCESDRMDAAGSRRLRDAVAVDCEGYTCWTLCNRASYKSPGKWPLSPSLSTEKVSAPTHLYALYEFVALPVIFPSACRQ